MSKSRVDRWWDTYNAALTGMYAADDNSSNEHMSSYATGAATAAHGKLAACKAADADDEAEAAQ